MRYIDVGKLGSVLYQYDGVKKCEIEIGAGYEKVVNERMLDIQICFKKFLMEVFQTYEIEIGIICVPKEESQVVTDMLISLGMKAIGNFILI